jgi:hypothetical protein
VASATVTRGIISALRNEQGLIQIDAAVNPGNSGGPLVTTDGRVVGIVVAKYRGTEGLNLAVPINAVRDLAAERGSGGKAAPAAPEEDYPLSGRWTGLFESSRETFQAIIDLKQATESVSGTMQTQHFQYSIDGGFDTGNRQLTLHVHGRNREGTITGTLAAPDFLRGTYDFHIVLAHEQGVWEARRATP